jgi:hypothetical protein
VPSTSEIANAPVRREAGILPPHVRGGIEEEPHKPWEDGVFQWDDEPQTSSSSDVQVAQRPILPLRHSTFSSFPPYRTDASENTPLLRKTTSFPPPEPVLGDRHVVDHTTIVSLIQKQEPPRPSQAIKFNFGGQSTFGQTVRRVIVPCLLDLSKQHNCSSLTQ